MLINLVINIALNESLTLLSILWVEIDSNITALLCFEYHLLMLTVFRKGGWDRNKAMCEVDHGGFLWIREPIKYISDRTLHNCGMYQLLAVSKLDTYINNFSRKFDVWFFQPKR